MSSQILLRRGTSTAWDTANPLLAAGEPGYETDTGKFKIGDGVTQWLDLEYATPTDINQLSDTSNLLFSGNYSDLVNPPIFSPVATSGSYNDLVDQPVLAAVATSGSYDDILNQPNIPGTILDLGITDGEFGQVLTASGGGAFSFTSLPTIVSNLEDLSNVTLADVIPGQVLKFDGLAWVNDEENAYALVDNVAGNNATITLRRNNQDDISTVSILGGENVYLSQDLSGNIVVDALTEGAIFLDTTTSPVEKVIASASGTDLAIKPGNGRLILGGESTLLGTVRLTSQENSNILIKPDAGKLIIGDQDGTDQVDNGLTEFQFPVYTAQTGVTIASGFNNSAAVPFRFYRSRGSMISPTSLQANDAVGKIDFQGVGVGGSGFAASIIGLVASTPTTNQIPGYLSFQINEGSGLVSKVVISPTGLRTNVIRPLSLDGDLDLDGAGTGTVLLPAGTKVGGATIGTISLQGSVDEVGDLPSTGNTAGDAVVVKNIIDGTGATLHLWDADGSAWIELGDFQGPTGNNGADGAGVPAGGEAQQILTKVDGTDYNTTWSPFPQADWTAEVGLNAILNRPTLFSGAYADLTGKPDLAPVALSNSYDDLIDQPAIPALIQDLSNVDIASPGVDQVLKFDGNNWINAAVPLTSVEVINDLTDVIINSPSAGQVLKFDGNNWINAADQQGGIENIVDLLDVAVNNLAVGQVLKWDGDFWVNSADAGAGSGATTLNELNDVSLTGSTTGQVLKFDGTGWINANEDAAFRTISVSGEDDVVANGGDGTLTLVAGTGVTITTDALNDTITISAEGGGGGVGLGTRATLSGTSPSLADGAQGPIDIASGYKTYALMKVETSDAAWVRIYVSEAARQADAGRTEGTDPLPGAGVIAEVITTGADTVLITPGTIGFNDESPVTSNIPIRVTNNSGSTAAITVTLTAVQLEA